MFSCLLIAPPGAGKTTAAATAPGPVLFIDTDNKLHKMENMQGLIKEGKIIQWAIKDRLSSMKLSKLAVASAGKAGTKIAQERPDGYVNIANMLDLILDGKGVIEHEGKKVKIGTLVLDSYTKMQEHMKRLITSANQTILTSPVLWGTMLTNQEILNDTMINQIGEYCNVIMICHEKPVKDELTGRISFSPLIEGSMRDKIGKDFEEVYYMEKKIIGGAVKYEMLTVGDSMKNCRTSRTLEARVEPNFTKIYGGNG